jgi:hypothetical protein
MGIEEKPTMTKFNSSFKEKQKKMYHWNFLPRKAYNKAA